MRKKFLVKIISITNKNKNKKKLWKKIKSRISFNLIRSEENSTDVSSLKKIIWKKIFGILPRIGKLKIINEDEKIKKNLKNKLRFLKVKQIKITNKNGKKVNLIEHANARNIENLIICFVLDFFSKKILSE